MDNNFPLTQLNEPARLESHNKHYYHPARGWTTTHILIKNTAAITIDTENRMLRNTNAVLS